MGMTTSQLLRKSEPGGMAYLAMTTAASLARFTSIATDKIERDIGNIKAARLDTQERQTLCSSAAESQICNPPKDGFLFSKEVEAPKSGTARRRNPSAQPADFKSKLKVHQLG